LTTDVVVVGGGLIGCLTARALADEGCAVALVERAARLGQESSSAAAGMLSPQMEAAEEILVTGRPAAARRRDAMLALCLAGRDRYRDFVRALEAETGLSVHYRADGTLVVAMGEDEAEGLIARGAEQRARGLRAVWLDGTAARALEPAVAPAAMGALHLPDDHQVDNVALVEAAVAALGSRPRIVVHSGTAARGLVIEGKRVAGVRVEGGRIDAAAVVLAAGAWTASIEGLPERVPIRPVKGQMVALRPGDMLLGRTVGGRGVYCVPRDDGRVIVGATVEEAGFDKLVDRAAIERLLEAAARVVPALAGAPVDSQWAGLRPGTADDLPVLGHDPELDGLVWATGHYRNGILLAPLTADLVAALLQGRSLPLDLTAFAPGRSLES
jgi:glycine oxidase